VTEDRFLQLYCDTVPESRATPTLIRVRAQSRERAIAAFGRRFGLRVDSDDGDTVWFVREEDVVVCQYVVAGKNDKAPTER
jgi:hypothetical protein